jgi:uncharacterized membrane protein
MLSITLIVLSFLNIRSSNENDDKRTTDIISSINICSSIILGLSFLILGRCIWFFYTLRKGEFYQEIEIFDKLLIFVLPFVILIVSIIQKVYISNYLPDMSDPLQVEKYNDTHTLKAEVVNNSGNAILIISIILFLMSIGFTYYISRSSTPQPKETKEVKEIKETDYDREMKQLTIDKQKLTQDVKKIKELYNKGEASEDLLQEYEHALGTIELAIQETKANRTREIRERKEFLDKKLKEQEKTIKESKKGDLISMLREGTLEKNIGKVPITSSSSFSKSPGTSSSTTPSFSSNDPSLIKSSKPPLFPFNQYSQ